MIRRSARGRQAPGTMNKTEAAYANELDVRKRFGLIADWRFEPCRLILAKRTTYAPDFLVLNEDMEIEFHEVKGHWEDDARVKIKVAARTFPWFRFIAVTAGRKRGGPVWEIEHITEGPRGASTGGSGRVRAVPGPAGARPVPARAPGDDDPPPDAAG